MSFCTQKPESNVKLQISGALVILRYFLELLSLTACMLWLIVSSASHHPSLLPLFPFLSPILHFTSSSLEYPGCPTSFMHASPLVPLPSPIDSLGSGLLRILVRKLTDLAAGLACPHFVSGRRSLTAAVGTHPYRIFLSRFNWLLSDPPKWVNYISQTACISRRFLRGDRIASKMVHYIS